MAEEEKEKTEKKPGVRVSGEVETRAGTHVTHGPLPDRDPRLNSRETVQGQDTQAGARSGGKASVTYAADGGQSVTAEGYAYSTGTPQTGAAHPISGVAGGAVGVDGVPVLSHVRGYAYAEASPDEKARHTVGAEATVQITDDLALRGGARGGTLDQPLAQGEFVASMGRTEVTLGAMKTFERADGPLMDDRISRFTYERLQPDHSANPLQLTMGLATDLGPHTHLETRFTSRPGNPKDIGRGLGKFVGGGEPEDETCHIFPDGAEKRTVCVKPDEDFMVEYAPMGADGTQTIVRQEVGKIRPNPSDVLPQRLDVRLTHAFNSRVQAGLTATVAESHQRATVDVSYTPNGKEAGQFVTVEAGVQSAETSTEGPKKARPVLGVSTGLRF